MEGEILIEDIRPLIFSFINKKKRNPKSLYKIKEEIFNILYNNKNLFKVINEKEEIIPYIQLDTGDVVKLDPSVPEIQSLFTVTFGIDIMQNKFAKEIFNYIYSKTLLCDKEMILEKFTCVKDNKLYISCGKQHFVTIQNGNPVKLKNGFNNIYFDSNYILPEWNVDMLFEEDIFESMKAFDISVYVPDSYHLYTKAMQKHVLKCWIIGSMLKIKPFPILLFYGNKSSGKTLTSKALMKLFMGNKSNVSIFPDNKRSLLSCITEHFLYTIDNLDSKTPTWFPDTLTLVSTGGELTERALFSNSSTYRKEIVSSMIITTRNGNFAKREDIKDRLLVVFFENRDSYNISENELLSEILNNRNSLLTYFLIKCQDYLTNSTTLRFEENYRFTDAGRILCYFNLSNNSFSSEQLIKSVKLSQMDSITDMDPLIQSILEFNFETYGKNFIEGTPVEIIKILEDNTSYINTYKPRVVSRKIKENIDFFKLNNWNITFSKFGNTTKFNLSIIDINSAI